MSEIPTLPPEDEPKLAPVPRRAGTPGRATYGEILRVAIPMILTSSGWMLMNMADRWFLARVSTDALAAAVPAGIASFTVLALFVGAAGFVNTLVAQAEGAGDEREVGRQMWAGLWFSLAAGFVVALIAWPASGIFALAGHAPAVVPLEESFFRILTLGGAATIANSALGAFYTGRGRTWTVCAVTIVSVGVNIALDAWWVRPGMDPAAAVRAAAAASVLAQIAATLAYLFAILGPGNARRFGSRLWRFDRGRFVSLMRYGVPKGVQFLLDVSAFSLFILLAGRIGTLELAATNVVFSVNMVAFLPMVGFHIALAALSGQAMGAGDPERARDYTRKTLRMTLAYMATLSALFVLTPDPFLRIFEANDPDSFRPVLEMGRVLLRYVALYSLFDTLILVFSGVLDGAGDTRFVMHVALACAWGVNAIPATVAVLGFGIGVYALWIFPTAHVMVQGTALMARYLSGRWALRGAIVPTGTDDAAERSR